MPITFEEVSAKLRERIAQQRVDAERRRLDAISDTIQGRADTRADMAALQEEQARQAAEQEPIGPRPVQVNPQAPTGGFQPQNILMAGPQGAVGGAAAQEILKRRQGGGGFVQPMNVPSAITRTQQVEEVRPFTPPAFPGITLPARTTRRVTTTEPNVLTPFQALSLQQRQAEHQADVALRLQEQAAAARETLLERQQKLLDARMDRFSVILTDPRLNPDDPTVLQEAMALRSMGADIWEETQLRTLQKLAESNLEKQGAVSTVGKVIEDITAGRIPLEMAQQAIEGALKQGQTTVTLGIAKATQNEVERQALQAANTRDRLQFILGNFDPELTGFAPRAQAAGLRFKSNVRGIPVLSDVVGAFTGGRELTPQQSEFLSDYRRQQVDMVRQLSLVLNELSGAAVSPAEFDRLSQFQPKPDDTPEEIVSKVEGALSLANLSLARLKAWELSGKGNVQPWEINAINIVEMMNNEAKRRWMQLLQFSPDEDHDALMDKALYDTERMFNVTPGGMSLMTENLGRLLELGQ